MPEVFEYAEVVGMKKRFFWLDHSVPEAGAGTGEFVAASMSNDHEVEMVPCLVFHPISTRLEEQYEIVVDDRDSEALENINMFQDDKPQNTLRKPALITFKGEEAKVIVISLVLSDKKDTFGFLKTCNRINALLSRAMHRMSIIGNARTSAGVKMWSEVMDIPKANGTRGNEPSTWLFKTPRHSHKRFMARRLYEIFARRTLWLAIRQMLGTHRTKEDCDHLYKKAYGEAYNPKYMEVLQNVNVVVSKLPCSFCRKNYPDPHGKRTHVRGRPFSICSHKDQPSRCPVLRHVIGYLARFVVRNFSNVATDLTKKNGHSLCGEICPDAKHCRVCCDDFIKSMAVEFLEVKSYQEVDLDEDPIIVPLYSHLTTMSSLGGSLGMPSVYEMNPDGSLDAIKRSEPFSSDGLKDMPYCPTCRGSLRVIKREKSGSLVSEVAETERALNGGTFVQIAASEERRSYFADKSKEFRDMGHCL
ncbi:hypothetical protein K469DRAFT_792961 [Zopfia rhizophila CBS 207.26]|uniref:DNA2/NAM7 helicase-like C-terminal domain-containing protein n=1 Tax=Zopfia rhizophila CBS 207.26 TaxID=1314779 RepID=A0A6A6DTV8_9PEZI|nr:hypothetical protein K469DRAFT_792961 [Zopfia rhizophila CBS 207.26]